MFLCFLCPRLRAAVTTATREPTAQIMLPPKSEGGRRGNKRRNKRGGDETGRAERRQGERKQEERRGKERRGKKRGEKMIQEERRKYREQGR